MLKKVGAMTQSCFMLLGIVEGSEASPLWLITRVHVLVERGDDAE